MVLLWYHAFDIMSSRCYIGVTMTGANRFNLRLPDTLRGAIEKRAETHLRSVNNEIVVLLKMGLVSKTDETKALDFADKLIARTKRVRRVAGNS